METGLVLSLPELAPALRRWRRHDPAARLGMPPHVTLIHPFRDSRRIDAEARARLTAALAPFGPLEMVFDRLGDFEGGVWLEPAEPGPIASLIARLAEAFPEHPPYGGAFDTVIPHLTLARAPERVLARVRAEAGAAPPLRARADAVDLFGRFDPGWVPLERFALGG